MLDGIDLNELFYLFDELFFFQLADRCSGHMVGDVGQQLGVSDGQECDPLANRSPFALAYGAVAGVVAILVWLAPQTIFHAAPRTEGFNPALLPPGSAGYYWTVALRFTRLVVVVPIMEEVFWRGFVLRYLVKEDFTAVPLGTFTRLSFGATALGFMLEHTSADYPAALITGALYNLVAVRTRSLPACIAAHAVTNLLLGVYIMRTHQWGFW